MLQIYKVIKTTASMILTKDIMTYFKNGVEIKRLENSIAAAKLNVSSSSVKYCTEIEAMLCSQTEKTQLQNHITNGQENN